MDEFINKIAEILDVSKFEINLNTEFRKIKGWSSMKGFLILIIMEDDYQIKIDIEEFLNIKTINELYSKIKKNDY